MRKYLNNPYVVGGLALFAVMASLVSLTGDKKASASYGDESDWDGEEGLSESFQGELIDIEQVYALADSTPNRNIFAQADSRQDALGAEVVEESIYVSSVWVQEDLKYATLDRAILEEGQTHKEIRVEQIERTGVWISYEGDKHFLRPGETWSYQYVTQAIDFN